MKISRRRLPALNVASSIWCLMDKITEGDKVRYENAGNCKPEQQENLWARYKPDLQFDTFDGFRIYECLALEPFVAPAEAYVDGQLIEAHGEGDDYQAAHEQAKNSVQLQMGCVGKGPTH